jgi:ABC-type phosphate transport system substrate-binding protein
LEKIGLLQFPTVMGGVVPVFNVPGIESGELKFDGPTLADFHGQNQPSGMMRPSRSSIPI